jgi:hypothetical protein
MNTDQSLGAGNETPVDLAAVQADEDFLNLLGSNGQVSDDELARILVAWRRAVDSEEIPELISAGEALAVIAVARRLPFLARIRAAVRRFLGGNR